MCRASIMILAHDFLVNTHLIAATDRRTAACRFKCLKPLLTNSMARTDLLREGGKHILNTSRGMCVWTRPSQFSLKYAWLAHYDSTRSTYFRKKRVSTHNSADSLLN